MCRETRETTPGDLTGGVGLFRDDPRARYPDRVFVTTAGDVTGRTEHGLLSCRVPAATAKTLTTAVLPDDLPQETFTDVRIGFERGTTTGVADPAGGGPFTTTARPLLDDIRLAPAERTLCRPRS
ncbi:MAG TPA: hypothetical protein VES93_01395 [Ornithinibacter sp.]|nr:hypothetical protein [Ornithinibacter sp.]